MQGPVKSLVLVVVFATLTVLGVDALFCWVVHIPPPEYETVDALRDYEGQNPDVLVLGSSYARSFLPLAAHYAAQPTPAQVNVVPIEGGKLYAYDWLLTHRLKPLIDERDPSGELVRPNLKHFVLVTNYWDVCSSKEPYPNLPARAWSAGDYLADFAQHGATSYNANYVDQRWNEHALWSSLVRDRGVSRILRTLRERISPKSDEQKAADAQAQLESWIRMVEATDLAHPECLPEEQDAALARMFDFAQARKLSIAVVLWPVIPKAQTPGVLEVTERFRRHIEAQAAAYRAQVVDLQAAGVLRDEDFRPDLDHLEPWGEDKVTRWAVDGFFNHLVPRSQARSGRPEEAVP